MSPPRRVELVVLTGAGISADSGVRTFRGAGGLWEGRRIEDVATPRAWARDPAFVWRFYQERRAGLCAVEPNPAHHALAVLEAELARRGHGFALVTQNVDDLHERAGSAPLHVHGSIVHLRCEACGARVRDVEHVDPERFVPCSACGQERLRPDVVWFEEVPRHLEEVDALVVRCTHFVAIGTSGLVWPVAGLLATAREHGATTVVMALEAPENLVRGDVFLSGRAAEIVPAWTEAFLREID
ncbi:MAG: NAD-dependent deacylase [Planctomycetes bacterium]|nr:NAD-dependent deacylase [Planctomycetota bacterium]